MFAPARGFTASTFGWAEACAIAGEAAHMAAAIAPAVSPNTEMRIVVIPAGRRLIGFINARQHNGVSGR